MRVLPRNGKGMPELPVRSWAKPMSLRSIYCNQVGSIVVTKKHSQFQYLTDINHITSDKLRDINTYKKWAGLETIPNINPEEFRCECCRKIIPPDEFVSYDPMVCINCGLVTEHGNKNDEENT